MIRILALPAVALLLLLGGCAVSTPTDSASGAVPSPASTSSAPESSEADEACVALSEPASLSYNAWSDFQKGEISQDQRNNDLTKAADLFRAVEANGAPVVENAVQQLLGYIEESTPDETGRPFDPGTDEFFNLTSAIGIACEAAGSELVVKAHGG